MAHLSSGIEVQRRSLENGLRGDTSAPYRDTAERQALTSSKKDLPPHQKPSDFSEAMDGLLAVFGRLAPADLETLAWHAAGPQPIRWFFLQRLGETMIHRGDVMDGLREPFEYPAEDAQLLVSSYLARLPRLFRPENCGGRRNTVVFRGLGTLTLSNDGARFDDGIDDRRAELEVEAPPGVLLRISTGRLKPQDALTQHLIKGTGDTSVIMIWPELFRPL
jgi:hypothetical protein